jgi:hypothetical protein
MGLQTTGLRTVGMWRGPLRVLFIKRVIRAFALRPSLR